MSKAPKSESLFIDGPAGRLQAIFEAPMPSAPPSIGSVVVCHPHPQHGGTMHNKVAHTLARAFVRLGFSAVRFNFRGTEQSEGRYDEGVGELDDALAVLDWMSDRMSDLMREKNAAVPLWIAGFSFGAAIAVKAAALRPVSGLVSVAPAIRRFAEGMALQPECPWLVVQGDQDELVDIEDTIEWVNGLEPGPELLIIPDGEHFFHGRLVELRDGVAHFVEEASQ